MGAWSGTCVLAVLRLELAAHVAVKLVVERLHVAPQALDVGLEVGGRHVVARPPERPHVGEADGPRALVRELDVAGVLRLHRRGDRVPAAPCLDELVEVGGSSRALRTARRGAGTARAFCPLLGLAVREQRRARRAGSTAPLPYALVIHDSMFASSLRLRRHRSAPGPSARSTGGRACAPRRAGAARGWGRSGADVAMASPMYAAVASSPAAASASVSSVMKFSFTHVAWSRAGQRRCRWSSTSATKARASSTVGPPEDGRRRWRGSGVRRSERRRCGGFVGRATARGGGEQDDGERAGLHGPHDLPSVRWAGTGTAHLHGP